ncbi:glycosyl transferase family 39 [Rhodanobacter thiooxydans]|uniref:glycosyl transferase family 39 n=1 Tax=Rhodanobacter thiooxydans TaxID=416169 RepID=UPI000D35537D|nr:glycosyl transferase family 39 [Rhodanobacter thiooxydans]
MRHLITFAIFLAAVAAYALGLGPLFFGAPLVGSVLVLAGVLFELAFWLRLFRRAHPASTSTGK